MWHNKFLLCKPNSWTLLFQETIRDAIEGTITWPVRQIVPILAGDYRFVKQPEDEDLLNDQSPNIVMPVVIYLLFIAI